MSYHLLHVFKHGGVLGVERGSIVLRCAEERPRKMPVEDVRAVIIAARGITLTAGFLSAMTKTNAVILHCDENYQPCGITVACSRIVDPQAFAAQANMGSALQARLWRRIVQSKILNQAAVLKRIDRPAERLLRQAKKQCPNEADAARSYWSHFFPALNEDGSHRGRKANTPVNARLNYGYAVLSALCHRSVIVHGLSPLLGMHHIMRYQAHAFVYDIMEPLRPWVDLMLYTHMTERPEHSMSAWCKHVAETLKETRVTHKRYDLKLLDALDIYISSVARCYAENSINPMWVPLVENEKKSI